MKQVFYLYIILYNFAFSYINIYPTKFNKDITNGSKESFRLYNRTPKTVKYRVYIEEGQPTDMSKWIEIYPKSILLKPLEEKEIKIFINPPTDSKDGIYKAKLVVKQVALPGKIINNKTNFMTLFKLNMTGYIGEINEEYKKYTSKD